MYGRTPMMISAQCIQKTKGRCVKDNGITYIKDRLGNSFPVVRNCNECFNTVLNCVPTMIVSPSELPANMKPASYRIHFTVESADEIVRVLEHYRDVFNGIKTDVSDIRHTTGHLKRGVE
jgi:putative protease